MNGSFLDDLAKRLTEAMPANVKALRDDVERNMRATLQGSFAKLDLVTREEFEVQAQVLARTRAKLEALERQVARLEADLAGRPDEDDL
jgi:BMFP domain-containing protein YqiC